MEDQDKTREQLIKELTEMRLRVTGPEVTDKAFDSQESRYCEIISNLSDAVYIIQDGWIKFANQACSELTGYSLEEVMKVNAIKAFVHPDDQEMVEQYHARRSMGDITPHSYESRFICIDGSIKWVELKSTLIMWEGKPAALGVATDITDHKRMEEALQKLEERYRNVSSITSDIAYSCNKTTTSTYSIDWITGATGSITGYSEDEFRDLGCWRSLVIDDDLPVFDKHVIDVAPGSTDSCQLRLRHKNGKIVWVQSSTKCVFDSGLVDSFRLYGGITEISERKQAEEKNLRLAAIVDSSDDAIIGNTLDGIITNWNRGAENIFGYREHEIVGKHITTLAPPGHEHDIRGFLEQIRNGKSVRIAETLRMRKDGVMIPVSLTVSPIIDKDNMVVGASAIVRDISDRVRAEQEKENLQVQLFHSQKMEALGTLVGGIAHDFNNMLQSIIGYSEILLYSKKEGEPDVRELKTIIKTGEEGAELVRKLLAFGQESPGSPEDFDLNHQIMNSFKIISSTLSPLIETEFDFSSQPVFVHADTNHVDQILVNLAINSSEAMPDGGRIRVKTRNVSFDADYCKANPGARTGEYVMLSFADTGRGMARGVLDRIFDPFFSTKQRGAVRGTGLGLSVVRGLVQKHGGHIVCESEPGKGTEFRIFFPAIETPKCINRMNVPAMKPLKTDTILVVEDNSSVAELMKMSLASAGYQVIVSRDGQEALNIYKTRSKEISLVVLDLLMPKMSGKDCLMAMRRICPSVSVLIVTGYSPSEEFQAEIQPFVKGFLPKPFNMAQLVNHVRSILNDEGSIMA